MDSQANCETRRTRKARVLLSPAVAGSGGIWADLGCGDGIFTLLMTKMLSPGSMVHAIDREPMALRSLQQLLADVETEVMVKPVQADFTHPLDLPLHDGLLLANSLHFVHHKEAVLRQLIALLRPGGQLVVIEYNVGQSNGAVPYPFPADAFLTQTTKLGMVQAEIRARAPSTFLGEMYTGVAVRSDEGALD